MQPLGAAAVEGEAAEQDDARDRVRGLREAGAREVVVDEALRAEAGEQALGDPLLEVQVDGVLGEHAGVLEDDRPDRRLAAPLGELLVRSSAGARSVSRVAAQLGSVSARRSSGGKVQTGLAVLVRGLRERLGAQELERAGERVAERLGLEADPVAGRLEQVLAALDLRLQVFLALARGLELLLGDALALRIEVRLLDLARQPLGVAVADAAAEAGARCRRR